MLPSYHSGISSVKNAGAITPALYGANANHQINRITESGVNRFPTCGPIRLELSMMIARKPYRPDYLYLDVVVREAEISFAIPIQPPFCHQHIEQSKSRPRRAEAHRFAKITDGW